MADWERLLPRRRWIFAPRAAFAEFMGIPRAQAKAMLRALGSRHAVAAGLLPVTAGVAVAAAMMPAIAWVSGHVDGTRMDFIDALSDAGPAGDFVLIALGPGLVIALATATAGVLANLAVRRRVIRCLGKPECIACGYDLRGLGSGEGGAVCPECGAPRGDHIRAAGGAGSRP